MTQEGSYNCTLEGHNITWLCKLMWIFFPISICVRRHFHVLHMHSLLLMLVDQQVLSFKSTNFIFDSVMMAR